LKGDAQSAESHFRLASKLCKSTVDNAQATQSPLDSNLLADLAWFFAHYDPKPDYAAMLSQTVLAADPDNVVARRVAAALMLRNNQLADAERLLLPVAEKDLWAAILLAEVYKKAGREEQVASKLRELTTRPANFEQRYLIQSKCRDWKVEPLATQPAVSAARKLAASIAPERRDYPFHPDKYLTAALSVSETNVLPGEPWWCTLRLTNKADFPITIGNGCMLEPAVLAVVEMRGDRRRSSDGAMQMLVDGRLRLMPRETLEVRQALDLGTIRAGMIGTPQVTQEVQLAGIINPRMVTDRENQRSWQPGIGGFKLAPVTFRRSPLSVDDGLIGRLAAQTRSGPVESRGLAMEQLAMLLGEHQHLAAGRVRYPARPIDVQAVRAAVLGMAGDSDWYVRARLAECMRWFMLDETTMPTAMKLLNDSHWLVRSLARRLLADQHGGKFSKVLETSAQTDPDPWAGKFARAILERQRMVAAGASEPQPERAGGL